MIQPLNVGNIHFYIWNGWNSDLHDEFSINTPSLAPLLPQLKVLEIDLKVWESTSGWCLGGWRILEGAGRGENFVWVKQGFSLWGEHEKSPIPTHKSKYFKKQPCPSNYMPQTLYHIILIGEREVFKICVVWGFQNICLRMGDRFINNIWLILKIALVWSTSRNIFNLWITLQIL